MQAARNAVGRRLAALRRAAAERVVAWSRRRTGSDHGVVTITL